VSGQALWTVAPGRAELRPADPGPPEPGQVRVRALVSGISRGTESLIFHGRVPASEWDRMRCPFQEGDFPFPVKYGYAMVGALDDGRRVLALYPHQSDFNLDEAALIPVPDTIPAERAVLAPQMETALNGNWDAGTGAGEQVAVIGGGVIGLLTAYVAARLGAEVTLVDVNPARRATAEALGIAFALPQDAPTARTLVFHTSGTGEGLQLALSLCAFEATVIELSWFGDKRIDIGLGGAFHSQRLTLKASQVGAVARTHRDNYDFRRRLTEALSMCDDPRLDALVAKTTPLADMPARMAEILADPDTLCHLIRY
jgi:NADPH:quinone reductase-like Zn-dependent oxidoreductase